MIDQEYGPCEECGKGPWSARAHYVSHWKAAHPDLEPPEDARPGRDQKPKVSPIRTKGGKPSLAPMLSAELKMIGMAWAAADPTCGGAVLQQADALAAAIDGIAQSNEKLYKRLTEQATNVNYIALALALKPIADAVREHHVMPLVERIRERREQQAEAWQEEQLGLRSGEDAGEPAA